MRGELRGGRFCAGFIGEQFAAPEAVEALRAARKEPRRGEIVRLSACDPLNLVGILTPGPRVPATLANTVVFVDGVPQTEPSFVESRGVVGAGARSWAATALENETGSRLANERPL
jgi:ATP-dependent Lhr-like helicase